ncbi:ABC transporter permease [Ketogulonicigenium vulgare]|uniref:Dipeptide transport system permease protein n=1 Tax=Ketogulonicigenium vulgare (strain WSH-001) TaxID=759362 RepID=F9Y9H8_KETVW|nr:ABC transporter permease [Ketogulonicigenium vulgare]ADO41935.1 peptide ABC transporter permease [Ketogulonicigenium vulgare Y25]AEM40160.1 Dipeptide transport system permease protein [Ketogulonicigenium vulgare WSH-001]ALJ80365.1 peptide ABC transporter [Ketogulonicigenium vulgare]ANW33199.1 peptide ABC transporter [Ketogulonicigenium vulgare]AOZ53859.1 peptide ABC transporter permease [Ketogulonicigenium vulgare]
MEFLAFLVRRLLWSLLVLFGLSVIIFTIARVVPGDPARMALGPTASADQVLALQERLGLNLPLYEQYVRFISGLFQGDLGLSLLTQRAVSLDIAAAFPATLELVLVTILLAFAFGVPLGVVAAHWKDRWPDNLVRAIAIVSAVMPSFLIALLLQLLAGYVLKGFPTTGRLPMGLEFNADITGLLLIDGLLRGRLDVVAEAARHVIFPATALALATMGQIARITRASMIDVSRQDYMEASRAFGVPSFLRMFKYQLRPSFVPPLTILGLEFASLIGGAFVVELIFAWPGMAAYGLRAITQKDLNAIMAVVMVSGLFFVIVNLLIDILVGIVDPRIRIRGKRA